LGSEVARISLLCGGLQKKVEATAAHSGTNAADAAKAVEQRLGERQTRIESALMQVCHLRSNKHLIWQCCTALLSGLPHATRLLFAPSHVLCVAPVVSRLPLAARSFSQYVSLCCCHLAGGQAGGFVGCAAQGGAGVLAQGTRGHPGECIACKVMRPSMCINSSRMYYGIPPPMVAHPLSQNWVGRTVGTDTTTIHLDTSFPVAI
jgi:hypothetical protein